MVREKWLKCGVIVFIFFVQFYLLSKYWNLVLPFAKADPYLYAQGLVGHPLLWVTQGIELLGFSFVHSALLTAPVLLGVTLFILWLINKESWWLFALTPLTYYFFSPANYDTHLVYVPATLLLYLGYKYLKQGKWVLFMFVFGLGVGVLSFWNKSGFLLSLAIFFWGDYC